MVFVKDQYLLLHDVVATQKVDSIVHTQVSKSAAYRGEYTSSDDYALIHELTHNIHFESHLFNLFPF